MPEGIKARFAKDVIVENPEYFKYLDISDKTAWAYNAINSFLNDTLGTALGGYSKQSFQNFVNTAKTKFETNARRVRTRTANDEIRMVNAASEALCSFIEQFMLAYVKFVPVQPFAKFSTGNYSMSSMLYFNLGKDESRQIASGSDDFMHQNSYVVRVLKEKVRNGKEAKERIDLISAGFTLENTANKDEWYYGWKKVEHEGWKRKDGTKHEPYSPFQNALKAIPKTYVVNGYKLHIRYRFYNVRAKHYNKKS